MAAGCRPRTIPEGEPFFLLRCRQRRPNARRSAKMSSQPVLRGKIIAIVDDHEAFCHSLSAFIESHGAKTLTYNSSNDFLRHLPSVDCVVVDYYMPDLNGLELASELRTRAYRVPI